MAREGAALLKPGAGMTVEMKPVQALNLWRTVLVETVRNAGPDLSSRQLAIVLTVYLTPPPHTVRGLASLLKISKPAVTRALDRLGILGLARRKRDENDRRSVLVQRTVKGSVFLTDFAEAVAAAGGRLGPGGAGESRTAARPGEARIETPARASIITEIPRLAELLNPPAASFNSAAAAPPG